MLLVGPALPLERGWLLPVGVALACGVVAWLRARAPEEASDASDASDATSKAWLVRAALVLFPALVIAAVAARGVAAILLAFPATWWALGALVLAGLLLALPGVRARPRLAGPLVVLAAVAVVAAAGYGARFEAAGEDSRGYAQSGPIYGIHPYQTTAVMIDGFGPFDVPINDFVEPSGQRGYDPEALAVLFETTLHEIAATHFADGPVRAYEAFSKATVEAGTTAPVLETLDRPSPDEIHHRFVVRSGTTGQRSRVEFRCPSAPNSPRRLERDDALQKMCPDKYTTEASAGLGVTGRWAGYFEARGNERFGLARLWGHTRSDDATGHKVARYEQIATVTLLLLLVTLLGLGRSRADPAPVLAGIASIAAVVAALACVGVLTLAFLPSGRDVASVPAVLTGTHAPTSARAWAVALVLCSGLFGPRAARASTRGLRIAHAIPTALVILTTAVAARWLAATEWLTPTLWSAPSDSGGTAFIGHELTLERFVFGIADVLAGPLSYAMAEATAAAVVLTLLVGVLVALAAMVPARVIDVWPASGTLSYPRRDVLVRTLWAVGALAVATSRHTLGGMLLLPGALSLAALAGSVIRSRTSWLACAGATLWSGLAVFALVEGWRTVERPRHFLTETVALGCLLALAGLGVSVHARVRGRRKVDASER